MKAYKTIFRGIPVVMGMTLAGWFIGCQDSSVTPVEEDSWLSEIKEMKLIVGEGHNYVVDQLMKNSENGLDLEVLKTETERFFRMKNIDVDIPATLLSEVEKFIGPDNKPNATFKRLAGAETAVGLLDSLLSRTDTQVSQEWETNFTNLAERMDEGEEFDDYIESAEVQDSSLMAHMWFADGIYDSSEAYWGSSLGKMSQTGRSVAIPFWVMLDVIAGALATTGQCALTPSYCDTYYEIATRFIVYGASASVMGAVTRFLP